MSILECGERSQVCLTPADYAGESGTIHLRAEEDAAIWLWAFPELFPWDYRVEWLFSPVNGDKEWRIADLWGLDERGELLLVESKRMPGGRRGDPFADFLREKLKRREWQADPLKGRWEALFHREIHVDGENTAIPGILPNSSKCTCLQRWRDLKALIVARIQHRDYADTVNEFLRARRKQDARGPHYCGLFVCTRGDQRKLLKRYMPSMEKLSRKCPDHVHSFAARAEVIGEGKTRLVLSTCRIELAANSATSTLSRCRISAAVTTPPAPRLRCPKCRYSNTDAARLKHHLVRAHSFAGADAERISSMENDRLYPKSRAPAGQFSVLGINAEQSVGTLIGNCSTFEDATKLAASVDGWPQVFIVDDAGEEYEFARFALGQPGAAGA